MVTLATFHAVRTNLDGAGFSTYILVMLIVPLKIWCRTAKSGMKGMGMDDVLTIVALIFCNAFFYSVMIGLRPALGRHALTEVKIPELIDFSRSLFVAQLFYTCCISSNKSAILAFYWRLFSVRSRLPLLAVAFIVVGWFIAILFGVIFTCSPVKAQWDLYITDAKCIETKMLWLGGSIPNVITDVLLLVLPFPYIWKLNMAGRQRLALGAMFLLGCFVSVVSVVRLSVLMSLDLSSSDTTFNFSEVVIWSLVEVNCGLICACLPSLKPAVQLLGLNRIFQLSSASRPLGPSHGAATPVMDSDALRPYRHRTSKSRGLFSSNAEPASYLGHEEDEDSYEMIKRAHIGQTTTDIEPTRSSVSEDKRNEGLGVGIEVKRDWVISEEPRPEQKYRRNSGTSSY